ncbi:MAG TPA: TssQ family T6SS-associated lipoprotein [Telluria sp.]|nr:TssQ family T6SS-associated lipoprotein [Telluria sp.]
MTRLRTLVPLACLLGAVLMAGCATKPRVGAAAPVAHSPVVAPAPVQTGLKEGIAMYDNGDYNDAIKRLGAADVTGGSKATQLEALKYSAFSYCLTARSHQCRQQFEKALKLDPSFDLSPGEHGHPLWGPVFVKAKRSK